MMKRTIFLLVLLSACCCRLSVAGNGAMCNMKTSDGKCCVFPFVYRGQTFNACTSSRASRLWCSLSPSYDEDRKYGWCRGMEGKISGDDHTWVYANGRYMGKDNGRWNVPTSFYFSADIQVVAVYVKNVGGSGGLIASFGNGVVTDSTWKCTTQGIRNWEKVGFDDNNWPAAKVHSGNSGNGRVYGIASEAKWIGPSLLNAANIYCRRRMSISTGQKPAVEGPCDKPLGLQSGWVENSQMTASTVWDWKHAAWRGRLHMPKQGTFRGSWSAKYNNQDQWLQVSFNRPMKFTAIATQGRQDYSQWVTSYSLSYSEDGTKYTIYSVGGHQKVFSANRDRNSVVKHSITPNIEARCLRLHPKTWQAGISMRMELYGCLKACKVDVGILMDESGSVSKADFEQQKNFVKALAGHFQFGPSASQFGVITFSTNAKLDITLNRYKDAASFQRGVNTISHEGGWTYTGKALNLAYKQLFTAAKGARAKVAKVLIIVTDGQSTGGMQTLKAPIKLLKDSSVNIISIGVGSKTNQNELKFMASSPDNTHVFSVQNMNQLQTLISSITASSCTTYNCRFVTCDYSKWSAWSATCGTGMRRARNLVKVNEHYIKKQGGCSGLKVTCDRQETETRTTTNCNRHLCTAKTTSHGTLHSTIHRNNSQKSKVTVAHLNVRSLKTREHLIQVRNLMDEKKYAILAISESWLNSSVKNAEVESDGYSLSRLDRPRNMKNDLRYLKTYPEYQTPVFTNYGCKFSTKRSSHFCCASLTSLLIVMLPALKISGTAIRKRFNTHVFSVQNMNQLQTLISSITASSCTTYNCRFVTCDYGQWSAWSATCGTGMTRARNLVKVNEHYIKKQGGCSGLKVTCDRQETETRTTTNCNPCISMTCSWYPWSSWSSTCGRITRQRISKATQSIVNRPNCNGLQTSCPKPEVESSYISCMYSCI
ncbi:unnamed protein product [Porites evermanni]|uniref:Uncharacterized protein n=1 Tax=Porites evermanni TaxID=104178 RepID=A0ABN8RZA3_9CNID|nr:unnamed protein product [Porites evermanni]